MNLINKFYTTHAKGKQNTSHELEELPPTLAGGLGISIGYRDGSMWHSPIETRDTTGRDYDEAFTRKIIETYPPYVVNDILDFHFESFLKKEPGKQELFIDHMEFVIGPLVEGPGNKAHYAILIRWIERKKTPLSPQQSSVSVNVGNNSIVQLQQNTQGSTQKVDASKDLEQFRALLTQIDNHLADILSSLSVEQQDNLLADKQYLEVQLKKKSPDTGLMKQVSKNIVDIIKSVPGNWIANIISSHIPL